MKSMFRIALAVAFLSTSSFAGAKSYQVTGPVLEVRPDVIVVQKGKEKWEISREATQGADLKVGDKVTIDYTMAVKSVEVKGAKPTADADTSKKAEKPAKVAKANKKK
ncbi:MAG: hypothetical protein RL173_3724 [Fibrobacterota bacterium]|jgi:hypothetical protein